MIFIVLVNQHGETVPDLIGLISNQRTPEAAVAATLQGEDIDVDDVAVECASRRSDCWYQPGPEEAQ